MSMTENSDTNVNSTISSAGRTSHFWSILLGAGILLFGMVIGACLTFFFLRGRVMNMIRHPEARSQAMIKRLDRALDLTKEQRTEVARILRDHRARLNETRRKMAPRIREELRSLEEDVGEVLNEKQQRKWGRYVKKMRRIWLSRFQSDKRDRRKRVPSGRR